MAVATSPAIEMPRSRAESRAGAGWVRAWLVVLALLVVLMVGVGGATRLTGSGLSITEWKPVTGAVPPLSAAAWEVEFEKYRATSQYRNLNRGMALPEFKTIYWWEWGHRQLGRFLGLFFLVPLVGFWAAGAISRGRALRLLGIGALGGLQATVGWIMVASGLEPGMVAVAPVKLMAHLVLASAILCLLVWAADGAGSGGRPLTQAARTAPARPLPGRGEGFPVASVVTEIPLLGGERSSSPRSGRPGEGKPGVRVAAIGALVLLALTFLQIALGGLVAGAKAGWTYNTWPLMDGRLLPSAETLGAMGSVLDNLVANPALVQMNHRVTAYLLVTAAILHAWSLRRAAPGSAGAGRAFGIAALALAQMALGIVTLLLAVPLAAGLAHQLLAMALLVAATLHARRSLAAAR